MRPSVMEINIENFRHNLNKIQEVVHESKIMPVIKANAYGTFINTREDILNEFEIVGVAIVDEAIELRKNGYKNEILVINPCYIDEVDDAIENDIILSVSRNELIDKIGNTHQKVKVHIEIETGMSRTGVNLENLEEFIKYVQKYNNIDIDGIYTHMSSAGIDKEYTKKQIEIFNQAVCIMKKYIPNIRYIHMSASNGIINFPEAHFNLVRPGMLLYGYESTEGILEKIELKPVCKLKSKINFLKNVPEGTSIGYMRSYITKNDSKIATIPIGYVDGLKRCLSNKGEVFINGVKAPIVGKICMDSFMADVTNVPDVKIGDDVWIWDNENITVYDIAKKCDTTDYEIITSITSRVKRIFK